MPDTIYKNDGSKILNYLQDTAGFSDSVALIKEKFPWFDVTQHRTLSQPYLHEYLNETVIRACVVLKYATNLIGNENIATAHRLFSLDSNTSMLYSLNLFTEDQPSWIDKELFIIAATKHYEEYGKPCNPKMLTYKEYWFVAPQETLETFNLNLNDLNNDTLFALLVDNNNQIISTRRYSNFDPNDTTGILASWQSYYVMHAKKQKRMDLVRNMFSKPYIIR